MFTSADEVLRFIKDEDVQFVDVRFCDLPGTMQHFTVPAESFDEKVFTDGLMFDGSSIRGFQQIHESDMLLLPDATTAVLDPFRTRKTLNLTFFVHDPLTGEPYSRDPRNIARKAEEYLRGTGIADTAYFGPEAEFYIFDSARFETTPNAGYYYIDSVEGAWNTGRDEQGGNLAYKPRYKGGYFPVPPTDHYADLRSEMVQRPDRLRHHGRDAAPRGRHGRPGRDQLQVRQLLHMADKLMLYKYVVKNVARAAGKTVTFMPKPLFGDNGSGMHCHQSLWKDGAPLFYDEVGYAGPVRHGPLLHRRPAQARAVAAGVHQPDGELLPPAGARLRGAGQPGLLAAQPLGLRPDPDHRPEPEGQADRVPGARPVLQPVPGVLGHADGRPRRHQEQDRAARAGGQGPLRAAAGRGQAIPQVPGSLEKVLDTLEADHDYLLEGGVFTPDLIETWLDYKRSNEIDPIRLRPHPHEFELYFDA